MLEQNEDYKKLKTVPGFSLEYTVTPEKKLLSTSVIDLNQIDAKSLEEISYFKDAGLNDLKNMKADALIKSFEITRYENRRRSVRRIEKSRVKSLGFFFSDFLSCKRVTKSSSCLFFLFSYNKVRK